MYFSFNSYSREIKSSGYRGDFRRATTGYSFVARGFDPYGRISRYGAAPRGY